MKTKSGSTGNVIVRTSTEEQPGHINRNIILFSFSSLFLESHLLLLSYISYNLRNSTKTTLYLPKTNNHYGEFTFKYFFNLFVEKICIEHIKMLFIDFKSTFYLILNLIVNFFWKYLKNLMLRTKKCVLLTTKRRKIIVCSQTLIILFIRYFSFILHCLYLFF